MPWVRVDSACYLGYTVLPFYDSLLAKLVVWGRNREEAIVRTRLALENFRIEGVSTTIPFHLALLQEPAFKAGEVHTMYVEKEMKARTINPPATPTAQAEPTKDILTAKTDPKVYEVEVGQRQFKVSVAELVKTKPVVNKPNPSPPPPVVDRNNHNNNGGEIRASMHGLVKELFVKSGETVSVGQKLLILEAMKMESEIVASKAGKVDALTVKAGDTVEASSLLLKVSD
jgi:acetyl-CoA/propionyl-CoA carboxylase biotin carboxyl carrier protein